MNAPISKFKSDLLELIGLKSGLSLKSAQLVALENYCLELAKYNEHTNLVAKADPGTLLTEHVIDSLALVPVISSVSPFTYGPLVDIGSGAGFPGLVLAIALPELKICLVESIGKKARFLSEAVVKLNLSEQVEVLNVRAEDLGRQPGYREKFKLATARAVGSMDYVLELVLPLLQREGYLLAQKSKLKQDLEQNLALKALPLLGGELRQIIDLDLETVGKNHIVMLIEKVTTTPETYPRPAAKIKRQPLGGNN